MGHGTLFLIVEVVTSTLLPPKADHPFEAFEWFQIEQFDLNISVHQILASVDLTRM